jgi:hypothetical protein
LVVNLPEPQDKFASVLTRYESGITYVPPEEMEMNAEIYRGMGAFVEFLYKLNRIPQKIDSGGVFYTMLREELAPSLAKWKSTVALK